MSLVLSSDELADLTGRKQPKRQMQWLSENHWRFFVGGDGLPKVDREYYREMAGVKAEKKRKAVRTEGLASGQKAQQVA